MDNCGRTVMVVVGRNIPVTLIDMEKVRLVKLKYIECDFWELDYKSNLELILEVLFVDGLNES